MKISTSVVALQPGLFILRHPGQSMPALSVVQTPNSLGKTEVLVANKNNGTTLKDGADCIVMLVTEASIELLVAAYATGDNVVEPAIKIDRVALEIPSAGLSRLSVSPPFIGKSAEQIAINKKGISILGHVERHGDQVAKEGELLGDPATNLRLEGFQIMWPDRPEGIDLAYSVVIEGMGSTPVVKTGGFCGTQREAKRITEVTFALLGPHAQEYHLGGEVHFSGGFQLPIVSAVPLGGPSGLEHLTALTLRVSKVKELNEEKEMTMWDASPRTKVFKAKAASLSDSKKNASKKSNLA